MSNVLQKIPHYNSQIVYRVTLALFGGASWILRFAAIILSLCPQVRGDQKFFKLGCGAVRDYALSIPDRKLKEKIIIFKFFSMCFNIIAESTAYRPVFSKLKIRRKEERKRKQIIQKIDADWEKAFLCFDGGRGVA